MNSTLTRIYEGFQRFHEKYFVPNGSDLSTYQRLATEGQSPKTLLIGCSDSRVDPAILMDAEPGEIFVIRNVGNLVPPCEPSAGSFHGTSSAIEFAVVNLKVENIIVLGHRQCGGIRCLMSDSNQHSQSFVGRWMSIAAEARQRVLKQHGGAPFEEQCFFAELESIKVSLKNLQSFAFVADAIQNQKLSLMGIYFDLEKGQLWQYDSSLDQFKSLFVE